MKTITEFRFSGIDQVGIIDENAHTIYFSFPERDVTALVPTITIQGRTVSPASGVAHDFSAPVLYTVTAADGTSQVYTVTVHLIPDKTLLTQTITDQIGADHASPVPVLAELSYTPESWSAYMAAITQAILVEDDDAATLQSVSTSLSALQAARTGLRFQGQPTLDTLLAQVAGFTSTDYTTDTWSTLSAAL